MTVMIDLEKNTPEELLILWKMRKLAKNEKAVITAQHKIDEYFLGKPKNNIGKKKREKKKKDFHEYDEWEY